MKKDIHPKFNNDVKVTCSCGSTFTIGSTLEEDIKVEICSSCHPFWTGAEKFVDTEGRVDKFIRKQSAADKQRQEKIKKLKEKIAREKERENAPKSLKDMLKAMQ